MARTLIHRAIVCHLLQRRNEVKCLFCIYLSFSDKLDQVRQVPAHRSGAVVETNHIEEHRPYIQMFSTRGTVSGAVLVRGTF
jgi:hypothetical protein